MSSDFFDPRGSLFRSLGASEWRGMRTDRSSTWLRIALLFAAVGVTVVVVTLQTEPSGATGQFPESATAPAPSTSRSQKGGDGAAVFAANCASCHQAGGTGVPGTFPPLAGNPNVSDPAFVEQVVREGKKGPIEVNGEAYNGVMPALTTLSDQEVSDVAAYVASLSAGGAPSTTEPPAPVKPGTVAGGKSLFSGSTGLENGGAACVGCHTAGSVGHLGGSGLGPNLTGAAGRLGGEPGLNAWLKNPPSVTMTPIFSAHPLTPAEIADLTAFLVNAPKQSAPSQSVDWLSLAGLVGLVVLVAGMALAYRGMRQTYRERLQVKTDNRMSERTTRRLP